MNILTVEKLHKSFGNKILFDDITFGINEGDKIGIIGVNGTGKSTLLKIIAGVEKGDSGQIVTMNGLKIAYLPQSPTFQHKGTVLQQVFESNDEAMKLVRDYETAITNNLSNPSDAYWEKQVAILTEQMDKQKAWSLESEAKTILTKLGITQFQQEASQLSGGQRKRVALARVLISPVDLLILDEPTNHIDNDTVEWLEKHLSHYTKALIMVTHDRYFLDRVANRTIELEQGKLYPYEGNYSKYLELKAEREELLQAGERKRQNFLRTELEWVRRGAQARSTKQKARLQRFEEIASQKAPEQKGNVEISAASSRLGKKIIIVEHISKSYENTTYINDFSYTVLRHDRIGIVGENGCGKSTLVKMMTGTLQPDIGTIEIGETVKIGVFSQENEDMEQSQKVIDYIKDIAEYVPTADGRITASQMLEKFLFSLDMQRSPISTLSGGEKRRLYLLKVLMEAPNILFLDEPTNDLDIQTLTILENYLDTFSGAVITVSHDRYFLDKIVNRIFAFEKNGNIKQYEGGYSDYKQKAEQQIDSVEQLPIAKKKSTQMRTQRVKKMTYIEQKEYETIGDTISDLEQKLQELEKQECECASDYVKLQEITLQKQEIETALEDAMQRWIYLSELAEEIKKSKEEHNKWKI
ncbi:ABC-F family ATP-binding cassette domain-containing protein [Lachnospiraceae bacterium 46-61]